MELDNRGVYHCEATNVVGQAKSDPAVININGIQQYIVDLIFPVVGPLNITFAKTLVTEVI